VGRGDVVKEGRISQTRRAIQEIEKSLREMLSSKGTENKEREEITGCGEFIKVGE